MACGECGDERGLCRCTVEAADGSVIVYGTGEPGDPYRISAPGAGAGTRQYDRAAIYTPYPNVAALPSGAGGYTHFDFYGPADPRTIAGGFTPNEYDGWYASSNAAPVALRYAAVMSESSSGTTVGVTLPQVIAEGSIAIVSIGCAGGAPFAADAGWTQIGTAGTGLSRTSVFWKRVGAANQNENNVFTGMVAPLGGYLEIYTGAQDIDGPAVTAAIGATNSLTIPSLTTVSPGALVIAAVTAGTRTLLVDIPASMARINESTGLGQRHVVATQVQAAAGGTGGRTFSNPTTATWAYSGVMFALKPGLTNIYYLWINGAWRSVGPLQNPDNDAAYATTVGDGTASTFSVVHPLATKDVTVSVVRISNGQDSWPVIQRPTPDTVYLDFGTTVPAPGAYRVLITKVG